MQKLSILTFINKNRSLPYIITVCFVIFSILLGVSIGTLSIPFSTILNVIFYRVFHLGSIETIDTTVVNIIMAIRLPRVILAFIVGSSLAIAGAAFQGLLKNPLADPYTLGVSSGASVGAVIVLFFGIHIPFIGKFTLPIFSISFAFLSLILVLVFARAVEKSMSVETIILTGIIFSSFLGSIISLMIALTGEELRQIINWLLGSVAMRGWDYIKIILPFYMVGIVLLLGNGRELNAFSFGEESAKVLGVNVAKRKMTILAASSLLTGAAVAVSGTIGFVGLVIPHITRLLWGPNHVRLLPLSMLNGGAFLVIADLIARTIITPRELPIGVITALIGAPVFAYIFISNRRG
ncbi:FecCD family ABC transporter permease [Bacillus sp. SCS-151]|uniref:FecCD family ABC transporter permease n=1 Tax=Nanhaiella sioensis TaxID=3115293 RepID=UPI00397D9F1A